MLDAEAQGRGSGGGARLVVLRAPLRHALALIDANRAVDDDARRRVAVVERRSVDQRLERGARLAACLRRAVELACAKLKPPAMASTRPVCGSMATSAPLDLGNLLQGPLSFEAVVGRAGRAVVRRLRHARRDIDDVARLQHGAHRTRRSAETARRPSAAPISLPR